MAIRTTETAVRLIIEADPNITDLTPFIAAASSVVTAQCVDIGIANALEVETWLAAHYLTIRDTRAASETAKGVGQSVQYKVDLGLSSSMYGQTAMSLDQTGGLARWNKQVLDGKAGGASTAQWLGTPPS